MGVGRCSLEELEDEDANWDWYCVLWGPAMFMKISVGSPCPGRRIRQWVSSGEKGLDFFKQLLMQWKDNSFQGGGDGGPSWDAFLAGTSAGGCSKGWRRCSCCLQDLASLVSQGTRDILLKICVLQQQLSLLGEAVVDPVAMATEVVKLSVSYKGPCWDP